MEKDKKKVVIIGAGIAGMTCGIYALDNGFDVTIYEKHTIAGGQCTGWSREGTFIDGCLHWIVGTNPKSMLFPLWKHIGAFDENSKVYDTEYFKKMDIGGEVITFYADLGKLRDELLRIAPEDKKVINEFIKGIKAYQHVQIPTKTPLDMMGPIEYTKIGMKLLPMARAYSKYTKMTIKQFCSKMKSEKLKKVFTNTIGEDYNVHSLMYTMQALSLNDAGIIEGGSLQLAMRVKKRFQDLGGKMVFNKPAKRIVIENNIAKGVEFEDGEIVNADYVISSADAHFTFYNLLEGKYQDKYFTEKFDNRANHPLSQSLLCSYEINYDGKDIPKMMLFSINKPFNIGRTVIDHLSVRCHSFDQTLNKNKTTMTVMLDADDDVYDIFNEMSDEEYESEKNRIGNLVRDYIKNYYKLDENNIKLLDVTTPLTYERYTNAYRGSYQAFIATHHNKSLMHTGVIKGLNNFFLTGQWLMSPGGLPIALFTGKNTVYRLCKCEHKKFVNKEEKPIIKK